MEVIRWRRFGKDRLYVKDDSGIDVGWWDLVADEPHPSRPEHGDALAAAVVDWRPATPSAASLPAPDSDLSPPPPPAASIITQEATSADTPVDLDYPEDHDLLSHLPGESLREQVAAAHAAGQSPTFLRRFFLGKDAYSSWELGAIGERLVGEQLARLVRKDPTWGYLNSIPVGENGSDIDHLAIGPGGVFTINAKLHQDARVWVGGNTFLVNGVRQPYVRNSRFEARRVAKLLGAATGLTVPVTGVVVPINAGDFTVKAQPDDVHVVNRMRLVRYLRGRPEVLPREAVIAVFEAARRPATWRP